MQRDNRGKSRTLPDHPRRPPRYPRLLQPLVGQRSLLKQTPSSRLKTTREGIYQNGLSFFWHFNQNEVRGRIEIVFATLVNDAQISIPSGVFIRQYSINLVQFERCWIFRIVNAYRKPWFHCPDPDTAFV